MAVYKIFPLQDASIYSAYPFLNTGLDAILETSNINSDFSASAEVARSLIQFDQEAIETVIDTFVSSSDRAASQFSSSLKVFIADASGVTMPSKIESYPISGSWNNGTGQFLNSPQTTNGCSWTDRLSSGSGAWADNSNLSAYVTASYSGSDGIGGGNWYTGSNDDTLIISSSQTFNVRTIKDIDLNVTDIVKIWYSSSKKTDFSIGGDFVEIENNGFILKWEDNIEFNQTQGVQPIYKSYAVDTNTIYPPVLEVKWDDQVFETGSLPELNTTDLFISLDSNPGIFYSESINRFRLNCRPEFPDRIYLTQSVNTVNHYINSGSLYAIKDLDTNEFVIDFDPQFTKISCDDKSNYFDVYMNGLEPERYYQILIQTVISGSTIVMDEKYYFKVVNG
tara:strand:- start:3934 stop:5115 length:1182 start_codon:yes stop_codon:yes gene_type:complete